MHDGFLRLTRTQRVVGTDAQRIVTDVLFPVAAAIVAPTVHGSVGNQVNATSIAITPPGGSTGKFALAFLETSDVDSITTPTGWTLVTNSNDGNAGWWVFSRFLASGASVTFTGTSSGKKALTLYVFDDVDPTTPINTTETPAAQVYSGAATTRGIPLTAVAGDRLAVSFVGSRGGAPPTSWTAPYGWTEGADAYNTSSGATTAAGATRPYPAGLIGGGGWASDTSESRAVVYLIVLNPDTGGAGTFTGSISADTPTVAIDVPTISWTGTASVPTSAGTIAADTPVVTIDVPTIAWIGTASTPVFAGSIVADLPAVAIDVPAVSWTGTASAPSFAGSIAADTPTVTVAVPTSSWSGTYTEPQYTGSLAADTPLITIGVPTSAWTGAATAPTFTGDLTADTPAVVIDVPSVSWIGTVSAPGAVLGSIAADTPVVSIGVPTSSWSGTFVAPVFTGSITADTPSVTVDVPTIVWTGVSEEPVFTGELVASLPVVTVGVPELEWSGTGAGPVFSGSLDAILPPITIDVPTWVQWGTGIEVQAIPVPTLLSAHGPVYTLVGQSVAYTLSGFGNST